MIVQKNGNQLDEFLLYMVWDFKNWFWNFPWIILSSFARHCPKCLLNMAKFGRLAKTNKRWPHILKKHILSSSSSKTLENKMSLFFKQSPFEWVVVDYVFFQFPWNCSFYPFSDRKWVKTQNPPKFAQIDSVWKQNRHDFLQF